VDKLAKHLTQQGFLFAAYFLGSHNANSAKLALLSQRGRSTG
jgi:hypothetical protein